MGHNPLLLIGGVAALGAAAYILLKKDDGGNGGGVPCDVPGAGACVDGVSYVCEGGSWQEGGDFCTNDPCPIKFCTGGYCDGTDLMGTGVPRCIVVDGEAVCNYTLVEANSTHCQLRYPAAIDMEINDEPYDASWVYQGKDAYCEASCDNMVAGYNGREGVDWGVGITVRDQWGEPIPNCQTEITFQSDDNLVAYLESLEGSIYQHCSGQYWLCTPGRIITRRTDADGFVGHHFTQIYRGAAGTIYRLIINITAHDPNHVREPLRRTITLKFVGLGVGFLDPHYTCQYPHAFNPGGC